MKILNGNNKNFEKRLDKMLNQRKNLLGSVSVKSIIKDVKKNGDKVVLRYEKKFNQNKTTSPNRKK